MSQLQLKQIMCMNRGCPRPAIRWCHKCRDYYCPEHFPPGEDMCNSCFDWMEAERKAREDELPIKGGTFSDI